ncbi:unnamed protein product, partial [Musa acuminata subsp. burmannicoides]
MEIWVSISSLGPSTLRRSSLVATLSWSRRSALSHLRTSRCRKMRPRRKTKNRRETTSSAQELGSRAATKGSLRAKGQRREARIWQLLCPPARSFILAMITRWIPIPINLAEPIQDRPRSNRPPLPLQRTTVC